MKKIFAALSILGVFALAQGLSGFSVEPTGDLETDLGTGINTLPQGGNIVDSTLDIKLKAKWIQYRDGDFYKAKNATFTSDDGNFSAAALDYNSKNETLSLTTLRYSSKDLTGLSANKGFKHGDGILVLSGSVASSSPIIKANDIVIDTKTNKAVIFGPFTYQNGKVTLKGIKDTSTLLLTFEEKTVKANTKVPSELLNRLKPYLSKK